MQTKSIHPTPHIAEVEMLTAALAGSALDLGNVLKYLSAANPTLCQIMQEAIRDAADPLIWSHLLTTLAIRRWNDILELGSLSATALERLDQAIIEGFTQDTRTDEGVQKEAVLAEAWENPDTRIRRTAVFLSGMRGNPDAIPYLAEIIAEDPHEWKQRAVRALAAIHDPRCAPPLLQALIMDHKRLHREARRALQQLGRLAESAWLGVLDHPDSHIRWHAARALGEIGDPRAAAILAEGLFDENYAVRWATADVLSDLGNPAVPAILTILSQRKLNQPVRQAAYHALHGLGSRSKQTQLQPLLEALHDPVASVKVPAIAQQLLFEWV